jgi:hypothetical protein
MTVRTTLVIGGGIGGPVAAMALQRAGIQATVYEATETPADYAGLFLNTSSNGLDVLRTLDIDVARRADGFPMPRMVMWSGTGKRLGEVANGVRLPDGTVSVALKRACCSGCCARRPSAAASGSSSANAWLTTRSPVTGRWWPASPTAPRPRGTCCWAPTASTRPPARSWTQPRPRPPTPGCCRSAATATAPPSRRRPTPSILSSAGGRSSATWCATAARSGGSPTSHAPRSRPSRSWLAPPPRRGSGGCWSCSPMIFRASRTSARPPTARSARSPSTTSRPSRPGTAVRSPWLATPPTPLPPTPGRAPRWR